MNQELLPVSGFSLFSGSLPAFDTIFAEEKMWDKSPLFSISLPAYRIFASLSIFFTLHYRRTPDTIPTYHSLREAQIGLAVPHVYTFSFKNGCRETIVLLNQVPPFSKFQAIL